MEMIDVSESTTKDVKKKDKFMTYKNKLKSLF